MLFDDDIHFCDEFTERVKVFTKGGKEVGDGDLTISFKNHPSINFDVGTSLSSFNKNTYFLCKSPTFTLTCFNCDVHGFQIFPRLIVKHKKESAIFKKISIVLQGVSEWMDNTWEAGQITDSEIKKTRETEVFKVTVKDDRDREFNISSEHWSSVSNKQANNYLIEQYTAITIEMLDGHFSSDDIIEKAYEIRNIFSLLLGYPLSIEYVLNRSNKSRTQSIYFSNNSNRKLPFDNKHDCISSSRYINKNNLWPSIFKNFYQDKNYIFKNLWSRVASHLEDPGFWEFEILAYVSLVDKYVSHYADQHKSKMSKSKFRGLREDLITVLSNADNSINNKNDKAVIQSLKEQVGTLKNSNISSFRERFYFTISGMGEDIKAIINFNKQHFDDLKKFRDQVAHGEKPKTRRPGDITYEFILKNKLAVLLLYWVYRDFGFSDNAYIGFLNRGMNPIIRQAYLNREVIDQVYRKFPYLPVTKKDLFRAKNKRYGRLVLEYKPKTRKYTLCPEYSLETKGWMHDPKKYRCIELFLASLVDPSVQADITYLGNAYLKNGGESYKIETGLCILNCPDDIAGASQSNRRIEYDTKAGEWMSSC